MTKSEALARKLCYWTCCSYDQKSGVQYCEFGKEQTGMCRLTESQIRQRGQEYKKRGNQIVGRL